MLNTLKFLLSARIGKCLIKPLGVIFYITYNCNLMCKHCNLWKDHKFERELSYEEIRDLLFELKRIGVKEINYSGGEPLLKKDFDKILLLGKRLGFRQLVSTNATLIDSYWTSILVKSCDTIFISLEGPEDVDNYIRGRNHFKKAVEAIKSLESAKKGIVSIGVTLMRWNATSLKEICSLARSLGIRVGLQLLSPQGVVFPKNIGVPLNKVLNMEDIKVVATCLTKNRNCFSGSGEYYEEFLRTLIGARRRPCVVAYRRLTVDPKGYIWPCSLWRKPVGHISEGILKVWFSENF